MYGTGWCCPVCHGEIGMGDDLRFVCDGCGTHYVGTVEGLVPDFTVDTSVRQPGIGRHDPSKGDAFETSSVRSRSSTHGRTAREGRAAGDARLVSTAVPSARANARKTES